MPHEIIVPHEIIFIEHMNEKANLHKEGENNQDFIVLQQHIKQIL